MRQLVHRLREHIAHQPVGITPRSARLLGEVFILPVLLETRVQQVPQIRVPLGVVEAGSRVEHHEETGRLEDTPSLGQDHTGPHRTGVVQQVTEVHHLGTAIRERQLYGVRMEFRVNLRVVIDVNPPVSVMRATSDVKAHRAVTSFLLDA